MKRWWRRLRGPGRDEQVQEELAFHLEMRAQRNREAGIPGNKAVAAARRQFGNVTLIQEDLHRLHFSTLMESLGQDLRYALRGFRRDPVFTATAVLAAALGIGATSAVFSVVDRILFRSLPYAYADRLVSAGIMAPLDTNEFVLPDMYFEWRKHQKPFDAITSFTAGIADCDLTEANAIRLGCARVEANFLPTLGVSPIIGRTFTPEEDRPNGPSVAIISYGLWQSRFARDPAIVGKKISLDGRPVTIVGVLPANFELPTLAAADVLLPEALNEATERTGRFLRVFARLGPGVTLTQAEAAMQPLFRESLRFVPARFQKEIRLRIRSLRDRQVQDAKLASWVLLAAVLAVLLIACANIANLLLARSASRQQELALRTALGAGRSRLIRQMLTESVLLAILGGLAGSALAWGLLRIFVAIAPNGIPRLQQATLDGRVLWFTLAASILTGLLFGLAPALKNPHADVRLGSRTAGSPGLLLRESLVSVQIAISLVLLTGAGMLLRSLWRLENVQLGMQPERVLTASFTLGKQRYAQDIRQLQFFEDLESRLRGMPGVASFAISDTLPPSGMMRSRPFASLQVEGQPAFTQGTGGMVSWRYVTPSYFATLGIPIVRGRVFEESDRAAPGTEIILNESLAHKLFPNGDAIGKRVDIADWSIVTGIARDVKNSGPAERAGPEYYVLRKHAVDITFRNQEPPSGWRRASVSIRTPADPKLMAGLIRAQLAELDPTLPIAISTLRENVRRLAQRPRFNAVLLSLFAAMGVLLAAIGLYGVMAFLIGQRTREIGVRMAMGATPRAITKMVLGRAAAWALSGAAVGLLGSLFATRALRSLLFDVPEKDPLAFAAAVALVLLVAFAAAWIPSRRAARLDPMAALRHD